MTASSHLIRLWILQGGSKFYEISNLFGFTSLTTLRKYHAYELGSLVSIEGDSLQSQVLYDIGIQAGTRKSNTRQEGMIRDLLYFSRLFQFCFGSSWTFVSGISTNSAAPIGIGLPLGGIKMVSHLGLKASYCTASSTSATWPLTFTLRHTLATLPSSSIRKVARSIPIYFLPYILFSTQTP